MIVRREAASWEGYQAKTSGQILVGDGTDIVSVAVSGDATLSAGGALTLAEGRRITTTSAVFNADNIVGSAAGQLNHASGVELVAAVAGKRIQVLSCVLQFTYSVAAYTAGGNVNLLYGSTAVGSFANNITAANSFGAAQDQWAYWQPSAGITYGGAGLQTAPVGKAVVMRSSAAFTQPGGAAGTGIVYTTYVVVDE